VLALDLGASFLGLIFAAGTPRALSPEAAEDLLAEVRSRRPEAEIRPVGVFVNEPAEVVLDLAHRLDFAAVQFHDWRPDDQIRALGCPALQAVRVRGPESGDEIERGLARGPVLLDTFVEGKHGGTGKTFDHDLALPWFSRGTVFIAGGLKPDNIGDITRRLKSGGGLPYAFDVSSGLEEAPGRKDAEKMRRFFDEVKNAAG
jgi:phosphoribosylanthranilate isomerase